MSDHGESPIKITLGPLASSFPDTRNFSIPPGGTIVMGRVDDLPQHDTVQFLSRVISRKHAELAFIDGDVYIVNLGLYTRPGKLCWYIPERSTTECARPGERIR